jgi:hypothetical protein
VNYFHPSLGTVKFVAIGHDAKDGWKPLTNDPTWPEQASSASARALPSHVGGLTANKDALRLENELDKLVARVEALESYVKDWLIVDGWLRDAVNKAYPSRDLWL